VFLHLTSDVGTLQWHPINTVPQLERPYGDSLYWDTLINQKLGLWQGKLVYNTPEYLLEEIIYS
jgi:hypothetical protein